MADLALISGIPVEIVKNLSHSLGNVAVGHTVGRGVRLYQKTSSDQPEQVQLRCVFIDRDRYSKKYALEIASRLKVPFPFITRSVALPFTTITGLVFFESSERRTTDDHKPVLDFSITLSEYKVNWLITQATKSGWVIWAKNTLPDPSSGAKINLTTPEQIDVPASFPTEYISIFGVPSFGEINLSKELYNYDFTDDELSASKSLIYRYDKIDFIEDGEFPQTVKIQYPPTQTHYDDFNNKRPEINLEKHKQAGLWSFPEWTPAQQRQFIFILKPIQDSDGDVYAKLTIKSSEGVDLFNQKVVPKVIYKVGILEVCFNRIEIDPESINGTSENTIIQCGVRLR